MPVAARSRWRVRGRGRGSGRTPRRPFGAVAVVNGVDAWAEPQMSVWWAWLAASLALGDLALTGLQLCLSVGQYGGAILGTWVAERIGTRRTVLVGTALLFGLYPAVVVTSSPWLAAACLAGAGCGNGFFNIGQRSWNALLDVEGGPRHTLLYMSLCSAVVSLAALGGGVALALGLRPLAHLAAASVCAAALVVPLVVWRLPDLRAERAPDARIRVTPGVLRAVLPLAVVAGVAVVPLGIVYTRGVAIMSALGATGGWAAAALGVFALAECGIQFGLWALRDRVSPTATAGVGGGVATLGGLLVCVGATHAAPWAVAVVGIALVGAGLAGVTPMALSVAAQRFPADRIRVVGTIASVNLLAIASAPVLVVAAGAAVGATLAAGLLMLGCASVVLVFAPRAFRRAVRLG